MARNPVLSCVQLAGVMNNDDDAQNNIWPIYGTAFPTTAGTQYLPESIHLSEGVELARKKLLFTLRSLLHRVVNFDSYVFAILLSCVVIREFWCDVIGPFQVFYCSFGYYTPCEGQSQRIFPSYVLTLAHYSGGGRRTVKIMLPPCASLRAVHTRTCRTQPLALIRWCTYLTRLHPIRNANDESSRFMDAALFYQGRGDNGLRRTLS
ncbi:hypothetical protein BDY19DRAFT_909384 [Irpex rosettiformis]|uniref:Uncharacterized protein n=1 Tax=Irpex rosettiformis TaxID=378272 RepID=A0ACB8TSN4_9APHY|nr:hypothetical protein BDY19DRAFT_909384 [Irpex rosettiformis]